MKRLVLVALLMPVAAVAAPPTAPLSRCPSGSLVFGTGVRNGAYGSMGRSIAEACPAVCDTDETQGGRENVEGVQNKRFDLGLTQVDTLELLRETEPNLDHWVRSFAALHYSYLHVLALRNGVTVTETVPTWGGLGSRTTETVVPLRTLTDVKGKPVAVWSSALITGTLVSRRLGLDLKITEVKTRDEGLKLLKSGRVWALLAMGGKPTDWVGDELDPQLFTLLAVDDAARLGAPYVADRLTYGRLNVYGLPTIKVRNEIVVRNVTAGPTLTALRALRACLAENLEALKNARDTHPAWEDVNDLNAVSGRRW